MRNLLQCDVRARTLHPGERLAFIVPHCDPNVNLDDRIYACRGD